VKEHPGYAAARAYIAAEVAKGSLWMVTPQIFREFMAVLHEPRSLAAPSRRRMLSRRSRNGGTLATYSTKA
jgi:hypothetical protein